MTDHFLDITEKKVSKMKMYGAVRIRVYLTMKLSYI